MTQPGGVTQLVTLNGPTGLQVFYTLDGSVPTKLSNLYNGPFSLTVPANSSIPINAIGFDPVSQTYSDVTSAYYRGYGWKPGDQWYNTNDGQPTQGFSGNIVQANGKYYMAGQNMLPPDRTTTCCNATFTIEGQVGVWLYSSSDLYNWQVEGQILGNPASWYQITRPHILWNASTSQYVMWAHCSGPDPNQYAENKACTATASAITGPWTWVNTGFDPDGHGYKDCNLFQDDDGTSYTAYTDGNQANIIVSRLSADYLSTTGQFEIACACAQQESPVLFKRQGVYFLLHGASNLYNYLGDIGQSYRTASTPLGVWSADASLFANDPVGTVFNGQPTSVFKVPGTTDGFIFGEDSWRQPVNGSVHVVLPLVFTDATHVQASTPVTWDLSSLH